MAELVHVGTADLPHGTGWDRYFRKLSFLETSVLTRTPPRPSVLAKWREAAPSPGSFALVATSLAADDAFLAAARAIEAGVLLFRTPPSFTPSATNRDALHRFFSETLPAGEFVRAWQPDGLWDTRTAVKLASELGVVFGCDPLVRDQTREPPDFYATFDIPDVYFRVTGLGRGSRVLSGSQLDELVELTEAYERVWAVFATVDSMADAVRFRNAVGPRSARAEDEQE